jgi:hypothetical protein
VVGIGLKLGGAPSDRSMLGREIRRITPELVLLGSDSRTGMSGELVCQRQQHALLFATLDQDDNPLARAVWAGVEPAHIAVVRHVLEPASRRCHP